MGIFHVEVDAEGSHGCQRDRKSGESVVGCEQANCPDCITREFVRRLKRARCTVTLAALVHWPGTENQVTDNLLTGIRQGNL